MEEQEYLRQYEQRLQDSLVSLCSAYDMMGGVLLENDDIESKFTDSLAQPYLSDAVREYRAYPEAAVAWAGYLGMAIAKIWDADWPAYQAVSYADLQGPRGFDDLDERITTQVLGYELDSEPARRIAPKPPRLLRLRPHRSSPLPHRRLHRTLPPGLQNRITKFLNHRILQTSFCSGGDRKTDFGRICLTL